MVDSKKPPVLIIGGQENALCVARSLGEKGITVRITASENCFAYKSRYCKQSYPVPEKKDDHDYWFELLLTGKHPELHGSVVMVGSDLAIEFIAHNKEALSDLYIMDEFNPDIHLAMLDKQKTLKLGKKNGCPTPNFWNIDTIADVELILDDVIYPVMIKPIHSHLFQQHYKWKKYLTANNANELLDGVNQVLDKGLELMVTEMIPGPDDLQSSYHTYIDEQGNHLFHYTHKIIRRYPKNSGSGCLHVTEWLPDTAEMGQRFFNGIDFRGMGHIEFKYDERDSKLKIIECNPRFSAAQAITIKSGLDMPYIIYCHITGNTIPVDRTFKHNVKRWMPLIDLAALRELQKLKEITFFGWIKSIVGPSLVFPYFRLSDPWPFLTRFYSDVSLIISGRVKLP